MADSNELLDMKEYLLNLGLITDAESFAGTRPTTPDVAVTFVPAGSGTPPDRKLGSTKALFHYPHVDVEYRGEPEDFAGPMLRAQKAVEAFLDIAVTTINGTIYYYVTPLQDPFLLDIDENKRCRITFTIRCQKDPSELTPP